MTRKRQPSAKAKEAARLAEEEQLSKKSSPRSSNNSRSSKQPLNTNSTATTTPDKSSTSDKSNKNKPPTRRNPRTGKNITPIDEEDEKMSSPPVEDTREASSEEDELPTNSRYKKKDVVEDKGGRGKKTVPAKGKGKLPRNTRSGKKTTTTATGEDSEDNEEGPHASSAEESSDEEEERLPSVKPQSKSTSSKKTPKGKQQLVRGKSGRFSSAKTNDGTVTQNVGGKKNNARKPKGKNVAAKAQDDTEEPDANSESENLPEAQSDGDDGSDDEQTPPPRRSGRGGKAAGKKVVRAKKQAREESEDEESESESDRKSAPIPAPAPTRRGKAANNRTKGRKVPLKPKGKSAVEEDEDSEMDEGDRPDDREPSTSTMQFPTSSTMNFPTSEVERARTQDVEEGEDGGRAAKRRRRNYVPTGRPAGRPRGPNYRPRGRGARQQEAVESSTPIPVSASSEPNAPQEDDEDRESDDDDVVMKDVDQENEAPSEPGIQSLNINDKTSSPAPQESSSDPAPQDLDTDIATSDFLNHTDFVRRSTRAPKNTRVSASNLGNHSTAMGKDSSSTTSRHPSMGEGVLKSKRSRRDGVRRHTVAGRSNGEGSDEEEVDTRSANTLRKLASDKRRREAITAILAKQAEEPMPVFPDSYGFHIVKFTPSYDNDAQAYEPGAESRSTPDVSGVWGNLIPEGHVPVSELYVFKPTKEVFEDYETFIKTIEPLGNRTGVVKVIVPAACKPPPKTEVDPVEQAAHAQRRKRIFGGRTMASQPKITAPWKKGDGERVLEGEPAVLEHRQVVQVHPHSMNMQPIYNITTRLVGEMPSLDFLAWYKEREAALASNPQSVKEAENMTERTFLFNMLHQTSLHNTDSGDGILYSSDNPASSEQRVIFGLSDLGMTNFTGNSLQKSLNQIDGIHSSYLYYGSPGSAFAMHMEDYLALSINYHHAGAAKKWIVVYPQDSQKIENLVSGLLRHKYPPGCDHFVRHQALFLPRAILHRAGIRFTEVTQTPGEMVVTFPWAYHQGWNTGLNIAEAIGYGSESWEPWVKRYRRCGRRCPMKPIELRFPPGFGTGRLLGEEEEDSMDVDEQEEGQGDGPDDAGGQQRRR